MTLDIDHSAVMKTTVFHEAFSDWLVPWYHYIPINYDYSDMYSVLLYFLGEPDADQPAHDEELRGIAERSKAWMDAQMEWPHMVVRRWSDVLAGDADGSHIHTGCASSGGG